MKTEDLAPMWRWSLAALLLLILIALLGTWMQLLSLNQDVTRLLEEDVPKDRLPCAAIPTRLVLDSPECAQKLLDSMNVVNVRVTSGWENASMRTGSPSNRHNEMP